MDSDKKVKFVAVYDTWKPALIVFIKSLLDSKGIIYYIDNENAAFMTETNPRMTVMVVEEQSEIVKELLKDI